MGCPEYDILITKYLDDALSEDEQSLLKLHLAACADCRVTVSRYRRLDRNLQALASPSAPPKVRRELFQRAEKGYLWKTRGFWQRSSVRIASGFVAAVVIVAAMLMPLLVSTWLVNGGGTRVLAGVAPLQTVAPQRQLALPEARVWLETEQPASDGFAFRSALNSSEALGSGSHLISSLANESESLPKSAQTTSVARVRDAEPPAFLALSRMVDWPEFTSHSKWRVLRIITPDGVEIIRVVRIAYRNTEEVDRNALYDPIAQMPSLSK